MIRTWVRSAEVSVIQLTPHLEWRFKCNPEGKDNFGNIRFSAFPWVSLEKLNQTMSFFKFSFISRRGFAVEISLVGQSY